MLNFNEITFLLFFQNSEIILRYSCTWLHHAYSFSCQCVTLLFYSQFLEIATNLFYFFLYRVALVQTLLMVLKVMVLPGTSALALTGPWCSPPPGSQAQGRAASACLSPVNVGWQKASHEAIRVGTDWRWPAITQIHPWGQISHQVSHKTGISASQLCIPSSAAMHYVNQCATVQTHKENSALQQGEKFLGLINPWQYRWTWVTTCTVSQSPVDTNVRLGSCIYQARLTNQVTPIKNNPEGLLIIQEPVENIPSIDHLER